MDSKLFLRIIAGEFGGRQLKSPNKAGETRPTLDRVKESLFDIIARKIPKSRVLDLCAGSGALGLEALSRGAASAVFLEHQRQNVQVIKENIDLLGLTERATIVAGELPYAIGRVKGKFDVIFFDPPYDSDLVERTLPRIAAKEFLAKEGLLIVERDRRSTEIKVKGFALQRRHRIGDSEFWFFGEASQKVKPKKPVEEKRDRGEE
jgi:16S rRNA (guanine966-N2)-methyltransferase